MKAPLPTFATEEEAADFVEQSDLADFDLSAMKEAKLEWFEGELLKGLTGPETPLDLAEVKAEGLRLLAARRAAESK